MAHSPAEFIRRPKISTESATLGLDRMELGAFIACGEAGSPTDHALACLLGLLGLRVSEACSSDVEDVGRPLLLARSGNRLNRHASTRIVRRLAKAAGITKHISLHSLRHSFITACLDAGVPRRDVQIAARHADPPTTTDMTGPGTILIGMPATSSRRSSPAPRSPRPW